MGAPGRRERGPEIRNRSARLRTVGRDDAQRVLNTSLQHSVAASLNVPHVVDKQIGGGAEHVAREAVVDQRLGARCVCKIRSRKWKAPGWSGVPDILNRRV